MAWITIILMGSTLFTENHAIRRVKGLSYGKVTSTCLVTYYDQIHVLLKTHSAQFNEPPFSELSILN